MTDETLADKRRRQAKGAERNGDLSMAWMCLDDANALDAKDARIAELERAYNEAASSAARSMVKLRNSRHRAEAAGAECERLREALKPFADAVDDAGDEVGDYKNADAWESPLAMAVKVGDFYRARAALSADQQAASYPVGPPDKLPADGYARRLHPTANQQGEREDEGVVDLRVVAQAYEFALSVEQEDGSVQIWGLTAGNQGYEPTGIVISADCIGHLKRGTP